MKADSFTVLGLRYEPNKSCEYYLSAACCVPTGWLTSLGLLATYIDGAQLPPSSQINRSCVHQESTGCQRCLLSSCCSLCKWLMHCDPKVAKHCTAQSQREKLWERTCVIVFLNFSPNVYRSRSYLSFLMDLLPLEPQDTFIYGRGKLHFWRKQYCLLVYLVF